MGKDGFSSDDIDDQRGRVAIVTGGNSGIGLETARALAEKGARVVLACRSPVRAAEAAEGIRRGRPEVLVEARELDLSSLASVRAFAAGFEGEGRLDLLIDNAGVMMPPAREATADGFELQMGTNHFGHFALTGLLLPLMRRTAGSRVVLVASLAHRSGAIDLDDLDWQSRPYRRWKAYGQSKLANLLFMHELTRRLRASGATTIAAAAHPGWTATNLQRHTGLIERFNILAQTPARGALPTLYAAVGRDVVGGDYYGPAGWMELTGPPKKVGCTRAARDEAVAARLFDVSEARTGVRFAFGAAASEAA